MRESAGAREPAERCALFARERAHLAARHHRFLLAVQLAARADPFLWPPRTAVSYAAERWADEEASQAVGSRRAVACAIGKAALVSRGTLPHSRLRSSGRYPHRGLRRAGPGAAQGRRPARAWARDAHLAPGVRQRGPGRLGRGGGTAVSALSSVNSAVTMVLVLHAATPW